MTSSRIRFNKPYTTGKELGYIQEAIASGHLSGNGKFTKKCQQWLESTIGCCKALLTHSGTAALEMAAIIADIQHGDEVIMPSYTFVSTADAIVLRGGTPVFIDIRPDTLNIDECKIEEAITVNTKAIIVVHYAGVACEMDTIMDIARRHGVMVIEDAAQALMSTYKNRPLGSIGDLSIVSFHDTKNIICGEGGALLINDPKHIERAIIIWEKGTNRNQFFQGKVDKYTWVDIGSSFLPSEINAAFLWGQLEDAENITLARLDIWECYQKAFGELKDSPGIKYPEISATCQHNGHMYYILLENSESRAMVIKQLDSCNISAVFHYVPLHSSPAGKKYGRVCGDLSQTNDLSARVLRLPLWIGLDNNHIREVVKQVSYMSQQTAY